MLVTVPDAPVNVVNDITYTNADQIGLKWDDGPYNGGTEILDYRITYEQGNGVYSVLQSGLSERSYILSGVTTGVMYSFRVEARNSEGYSAYSLVTQILAA